MLRSTSNSTLRESDLGVLENEERESWTWIFEQFRDPASQLEQAVLEGLDHVLYTLELIKMPATSTKIDVEANVSGSSAEALSCADKLEKMIERFMTERESPLRNGVLPRAWATHSARIQLHMVRIHCMKETHRS
jgi:hypothetical protein